MQVCASQPLPFTPKLRSCHDRTRNCKRYPFAGSLEFNRHHAFRVAVARDLDTHYDPDQCETAEGPGTTQAGILLIASPLPDGSFDVAEIVLLSTPTSVRLGPPRLGQAGSRFSRAKPVASQVQVTAGDQPVRVPDSRIAQRVDLL